MHMDAGSQEGSDSTTAHEAEAVSGSAPDDIVAVDRSTGDVDEQGSTEAEDVDSALSESALVATLGALEEQVKRFHDRSTRSEEIIRTMQSRITDLQGDQIQALLKPTIQRFAGLHAQAMEAQQSALERNESAAADFSFFATSIEDALGLIDFDSVHASPGAAFDATRHHATSMVSTGDPALDKTVHRVIRQGFTRAGSARVSIPAQVAVYQYDETLATTDAAAHPLPEPITDPSITL